MADTLPGTPYVESSDLVANYPAVSEDLAERVDLVGILPFADSTARGTALPTPTDGQYSYLQDTNSTEFWNGAAWVAAGVTPGLTHITTSTFTAVSDVSINNVFTSTYENYLVILNIPTKVTNGTTTLRLRASGSDTTTNYRWVRGEFISSAASSGQEENNSTTALEILFQEGSGVAMGELLFYAPQIANRTLVSFETLHSGATNFVSRVGGGVQTDSTAFDGFSLITSAGTMTGTIRVYGYKNS